MSAGRQTEEDGMAARTRIEWASQMYGISAEDAGRVVAALDGTGDAWGNDLPTAGDTIDNGHSDTMAGHNGYYATWDNGAGVLVTNGDPVWTEDWRNDSDWREIAGL
jgi:hypothetical protein